ncbi:hypothetical protein BWQ96_10001 [Gracilariopsis chorda]|uniref:Uncharacterized protein n=1 Tax=Gracilariopsis chorda TaxID=448386 RepID=A0A2V3IDY7_9FLOR|nr:hypothetical protein BWQ96_10001 [Gracilariopsis chorda]|eukprot:PXF40295.1 hypothetical protein BWQ96_10001 [Gracilariopsis chorda]
MDSVKQNVILPYCTLLLIMLWDHAAQDTDVVNNLPFPLFKPDSSVHKSQEVVDKLSQICLQTLDSLNRFLGDLGYRLEYDCPPWDRISNFAVRDLGTDLRDGIRSCKLASLLTGDPRPLQQMKYNYGSRLSDATRHKKHSFNIMIALVTISKYATDRLRAKVQWKATAREIIDGNIPEIVALLWEIAEL